MEEIRQIVQEHGRLPAGVAALDDEADLYQAGLSSHASVNIMLALEGRFDIEFPDRMLKRGVFRSIASIREAIAELAPAALPQVIEVPIAIAASQPVEGNVTPIASSQTMDPIAAAAA